MWGAGFVKTFLLLQLVILLLVRDASAAEGGAGACSVDEGGQQEPAQPGVGSWVVHEDDDIKMWELQLAPGESSGLHTHSLPYAFYVLNSSTLEVTDQDGNHLLTFTGEVGNAFAFDLDGDYLVDHDRGRRIHKTHDARNIGTTLFREVLVEKKASPAP